MNREMSLNMVMQVWNDDTGERIEVGEDRDGLGLLEIRYVSEDGKFGADIRMQPEHAPKLIEAIQRAAEFMLRDAKHTRTPENA